MKKTNEIKFSRPPNNILNKTRKRVSSVNMNIKDKS